MRQIYNHYDRRSPASIMLEGQVFTVKKQYFKTTSGGATSIRFDHLSDTISVDGEDERIPEKWRPRIRLLARRSLDWKALRSISRVNTGEVSTIVSPQLG